MSGKPTNEKMQRVLAALRVGTQRILAALRIAAIRTQPVLQSAAKWSMARFVQLKAWLPEHPRAATLSGIGAALAVTLMLAGIPGRGTPERQVERLALSGQDLFRSLCDHHAGVQRGSRVEGVDDRTARTNLIVMPDTVWQDLSLDQRNSLGSWLNTIGGRWEIRVGTASKDGARVLEAEAVITSRQWNEQLK